ncbi:replication-relaxation family protein [Pseudonocardia sp. HH130630-07]|uniref:replication-relaxation family protein n=1 Tax=Pseudonocardia sp. HH130630-07 TaxID=1690815 RepID=UPI0008151A93|nr:replication-relaxation family protein [Pseudonocardia sp. HH130630-07]ANY07797.1 hypothetical protein AFB00_17520 [Pseudonocardia sp. HH130630-07]
MSGTAARPTRTTTTGVGEAARRIGDRDRWLLRMLHEHTVLTTPQLVRLGFAHKTRATQQRLTALQRLGVLDRFQPLRRTHGTSPMHHLLGPLGARLLAAELGVEVAALGWRRDRSQAVAHRLSLSHDVATIDLICELVSAPGVHIDAWWSPARCRRVVGRHVLPDAYLALTATGPTGGRARPVAGPVWEMFLEYDTGTTALRALAAKLHGYHKRAVATRTAIPVGIWIARPGREPGARRALAAVHRTLTDPDAVPVFTATPLIATAPDAWPVAAGPGRTGGPGTDAAWHGASGRVWLPLRQRAGHAGHRFGLVELAGHRHADRPTLAETTGPADSDGGYGEPDTVGGRVELPTPSPYPPHAPARPVAPPPHDGRHATRDTATENTATDDAVMNGVKCIAHGDGPASSR